MRPRVVMGYPRRAAPRGVHLVLAGPVMEQPPRPPRVEGADSFPPTCRHTPPPCAYTLLMTSRQMNAIPAPIVVLDSTAYCDGPDAHEARIVTDGHRAVARLTHTPTHVDYTDAVAVARVGVMLEGGCPAEWHGGPCPGSLSWSMETPGAWTAHHASITLLTTYGEQVER